MCKKNVLIGVLLAMLLLGSGVAQASLLVYEGFDYPLGELLDGQTPSAGLGMTGSWITWTNQSFDMRIADGPRDPYQWRSWDGVAHNVAQTGGFISLGFDGRAHVRGMITMDSSVTDTFVDGSTTWMSCVAAQGDVPWGYWPLLAVGAGDLIEDRGANAADQAIGGGAYHGQGSAGDVGAHYWDDEDSDGTYEIHPSAATVPSIINVDPLLGPVIPYLMVFKITWSDTGNDTVEVFQFDVSAGAEAPTEAAFDLGAVSNSADLDQSLFDTLSYGGGRFELDEIRIGTTFNDVITGTTIIDLGENPKNGSTVGVDRTDPLSWILPEPNDVVNGTVTCDVWFTDDYPEAGLYAGDPNFTNYATKIVGQVSPEAVQSVPIPVTLEELKTYYWRIDTYDDSTDEPQPVIGPVFTFNAVDSCTAAKEAGVELLQSDFNEDCVTDFADLVEFIGEWLENVAL